jgi:hypothetical protein
LSEPALSGWHLQPAEGRRSYFEHSYKKAQGFDRLSPNGSKGRFEESARNRSPSFVAPQALLHLVERKLRRGKLVLRHRDSPI